MRIGAHQSVAGGLALAFDRAVADGAESLQLFTKSSRQWAASPISDAEARAFRAAAARTGLPALVHDSYLINLGAEPGTDVRARSLDAFRDELERCEQLGVRWLVAHPGAHAEEARGLGLIAAGLDEALAATAGYGVGVLLEITAGQGVNLGYRFEHLRQLLDRVRRPERLGICLDTCHLFAAGYDLATDQGFDDTIGELERVVGLRHVHAIHVNDCQKERGCRVDRHANLGHGTLGRRAFERLVTEPRLAGRLAVLETAPDAEGHWRGEIAILKGLRDGTAVAWPAPGIGKAAAAAKDAPKKRTQVGKAAPVKMPGAAAVSRKANGRPSVRTKSAPSARAAAARKAPARPGIAGAAGASKSRVKTKSSAASRSAPKARGDASSRPARRRPPRP